MNSWGSPFHWAEFQRLQILFAKSTPIVFMRCFPQGKYRKKGKGRPSNSSGRAAFFTKCMGNKKILTDYGKKDCRI